MPSHCSVCVHPQRAKIDAAIVAGASLRNTAARFKGPTWGSIHRHTKHIQATLLAAICARNAASQEQLYAELCKVVMRELAVSQIHRDTLMSGLTGERHITAKEWQEAIDGMFGGHVRILSYLCRLFRDGADSGGPNSRRGLIQGLGEQGPTLHRV